MMRRVFALAAGIAVITLAGSQPALADQCTSKCDTAFQQCNGTNNDASACLPKWGQCKRACAGPVTTPAKVTPVATTTAVKTTVTAKTPPAKGKKPADAKSKSGGK